MRGSLVPLLLCGLLLVAAVFDGVEAKRSSGSRKSGSSGGFFSRRKPSQTSQTSTNQKHQTSNSKNHTSGFGGSHGGSSTFLNQERNQANSGFGGMPQPQPGRNTNPIGFEHFNPGSHKPSAPVMPGQQPGGFGSAFGGSKTQNTHVQSQPPYPTHNNPGGFGTNPGGGHYNQPGGFGSNPAGGTHYNQPGGFGTNPVGGTHYNQPGGFGGTQHQPGGFGSGTHYNQPGYGQQGGSHFGQPGYGSNVGGGYHPSGNTFGGNQPHYNNYGGGHSGYNPSPGYNPGGFGGGHNPGGFGGGYPGSYGGGYHPQGGGFGGGYSQGGMMPGSYKHNSGPGLGTGLLGGAAAALPLGLLVGYGIGSMGSHSTPSLTPSVGSSPSSAPSNNDAFEAWLKQRTEEEKKKEEAKIAAEAGSGGAGGTVGGSTVAAGGALAPKTTVNETEIINRILNQTTMCPGGAGILDASFLNTLVPCDATDVDFNETELTEPYDDDCKSVHLTLIQLNTGTNENKTVELTIKQINVTTAPEPGTLAYDLSFDSCLGTIGDPSGKFCVNKGFTVDPYHVINETLTFLHTANYSMTQFNTTLNVNSSCASSGACGPDSKAPRNITSTFINLSLLPLYPVNILMSQCMIFKKNMCDPASTVPCDLPLKTVKQTINTNTTLSTSDFANINFVLHGSTDIFMAFQNPPPAPPPPAPEGANPGSSSTLIDTSTTKSSATTI